MIGKNERIPLRDVLGETHKMMVDTMLRLENAFHPRNGKLRV